MYEDEFELTFQVPEEERAPEPLAAPAAARRVLISGGDRGIGAAAARAFAAAGYQVAVLYHQNAAAAAALEAVSYAHLKLPTNCRV